MKFLDLLFHKKHRPTMQEAIDKCLAAGVKPIEINSAMMAIALDEIKSIKSANAELLEVLEALVDDDMFGYVTKESGYVEASALIVKARAAIAKARGEA